jgi:hypothetical protein
MYEPKRFFVSLTLAFTILNLIFFGSCSVGMMLDSLQVTAYLRLADDASSPEQKAAFLRAFRDSVTTISLAEHGGWFVRNERTAVVNQLPVLDSLIRRCDETAQLPRESFGYAQGMTQIAGQEFDHAIGNLSHIYETAFIRQCYGWMYWAWVIPLALFFPAGLWRLFLVD